MKKVLKNVIFTPSAKTLDFSAVAEFDIAALIAVINNTTGTIIYGPAISASLTGTFNSSTRILTLIYDTTAMSASDVIQVQYDSSSNLGNSPVLFNDNFDTFNTSKWNFTKSTNDLILDDGNTASCNYLNLALSPLDENTETVITSNMNWMMPMRIGLMASCSQFNIGQEYHFRLVSTENLDNTILPIAITSVNQTTTTATVVTSVNHNFNVGTRISLSGCSDSRANYSNVVVASIISPTSFTFTAGAGGTIPSLTLTAVTGGFVYFRNTLGYAKNGTAQIIENTSSTEASYHSKTGTSGIFRSGTISGKQTITTDSMASVQSVVGVGEYNFNASSVIELVAQPEYIEWLGKSLDASNALYNLRIRKDQAKPDPTKIYKLQIAVRNNPGVTRITGKIISSVKTGTTTSTITHDGTTTYTTGDFVQLYGRRDIVNFPNLTTPTIISSIIDANNFTIIDGAAVTATTYGGTVNRVNGSQSLQGIITQNIQNAVRGADGLLVLTGSASWSGLLRGDYINIHGVRSNIDGSDIGIDGHYRVRDFVTTALTLESLDGTPSGILSSIACGGVVIKKSVLRINNVRVAEFNRHVTENIGGLARNDISAALPVSMVNTPSVTLAAGAASVGTVILGTGSNTIGALTANQSVNFAQVAAATPITISPNGATNKGLLVGISGPITNTDYSAQAWSAASGSGAVIVDAVGMGATCAFDVNVTAWTAGASTGLDIYLQESPDNGTIFYDIWQCEAITGIARARIPAIPVNGRRRFRWVNRTGAATTATVTITATSISVPAKRQAQYFDRTSGVGSGTATLNTTTSAFDITGCKVFTIMVIAGTATGAATYQVEMSQDSTNWYPAGTATALVASSNNVLPITANTIGRFLRVKCTVAGTSQLVNAIHIYTMN